MTFMFVTVTYIFVYIMHHSSSRVYGFQTKVNWMGEIYKGYNIETEDGCTDMNLIDTQ